MGKHDINAFLGAGTSFTGRLTFEGVVRIDGRFDGEIASTGSLVVGRNAHVSGQVEVGRLLCGGLLEADVRASQMVAVHATGRVVGSVCTPSLVVDEGGCLDGMVVMETDLQPAPTPRALDVAGEGESS